MVKTLPIGKNKPEVSALKNILKYIGLFVIGLTMAVVIYPVIHEFSHSVVATVIGVTVIKVSIFPLPYVLCDMVNSSIINVVAVGMSGIVLPFALSLLIKTKNFWIWYANYIIVGISTFSFAITIVSTILFMMGKPMNNDDVTQILTLYPDAGWFVLVIAVLLLAIGIIKLSRAGLISRCVDYFL